MRKILGFTLLTLLLVACGIVPPVQAVTPTATFTSQLTRRVEPVETLTPTLIVTQTPAEPRIPAYILTPDAVQVTRWQEYQTELAKVVLYGYGPDAYKNAFCEWDILGRSDHEVYIWAYCVTGNGRGNGLFPTVIYLKTDGTIQEAKAPRYKGADYDLTLFPADVREKIVLYYSPPSPNMGRLEVLRLHLRDRLTHPDELPLIVLIATPAP